MFNLKPSSHYVFLYCFFIYITMYIQHITIIEAWKYHQAGISGIVVVQQAARYGTRYVEIVERPVILYSTGILIRFQRFSS